MFGNIYYIAIQRTYNSFSGAAGAQILTLDAVHPNTQIQLNLTGYVAAVAVVYGQTSINSIGSICINSPSYSAAVTRRISGYVVIS